MIKPAASRSTEGKVRSPKLKVETPSVSESDLAGLESLEFTKQRRIEPKVAGSRSKESKAELDDSQMNGRLGWAGRETKVRKDAG